MPEVPRLFATAAGQLSSDSVSIMHVDESSRNDNREWDMKGRIWPAEPQVFFFVFGKISFPTLGKIFKNSKL
jgi:hypothetical protein